MADALASPVVQHSEVVQLQAVEVTSDAADSAHQPVGEQEPVAAAGAEEEQPMPEQPPRALPARRKRESRKRERDVEALSAKAEKLERAAKQEEETLRDMAIELEEAATEFRTQIEGASAIFKKQKDILTASRKSAAQARQEMAVVDMPAARQKPASPLTIFMRAVRPTLVLQNGGCAGMKKIAELWSALSLAEKLKYKEAYAAEMQEYKKWACSDEGQAILAVRSGQKLHSSKISICCGGEGLATAKALAAVRACVHMLTREFGDEESSFAVDEAVEEEQSDSGESPAKRAKAEPHTPPQRKHSLRRSLAKSRAVTHAPEPTTTPVKQRSSGRSSARSGRSSARSPKAAIVPAIKEEVLQQANSLSLSAQLINLANRPEVQALKKSSQELLDALTANDGIVNVAKRFLIDPPLRHSDASEVGEQAETH